MSGAAPPAKPAPPASPNPSMLGISVVSAMTTLFAGLALAAALWMYMQDHAQKDALVGAIGLILGKWSTIIDWWAGSSKSSQQKDSTIANQLPTTGP